MAASRMQNRILQMLYKPGAKKKKPESMLKSFDDMEKALEKGIGAIAGKKDKSDDKKDDKKE